MLTQTAERPLTNHERADLDHEHRIALYAERFERGLGIFTGEPIDDTEPLDIDDENE